MTCHNGYMIEELEFIEQLQNIKRLISVSPQKYTNIHVLKYIDIFIDLHEKRVEQFEQHMEKEYAKMHAHSTRPNKSEHEESKNKNH